MNGTFNNLQQGYFIYMNILQNNGHRYLKTQGSVSDSVVLLGPLAQLTSEKKYSSSKLPKLSSIQEYKKCSIFAKSNNFSAIFVESKRKDYSGYKEYSLKKIAGASPSNRQKCVQQSQSQKKIKTNQRYVSKLRKRYSLQPVVLRKKLELLKSMNKNLSNTDTQDPFAECIDSGREHCRSLRSVMQSLKKRSTSERPFVFGGATQNTNTDENQNGQNGSNFQRYNLTVNNKSGISVIAQDFGQDMSVQKSLIHYKKKVEIKLKQKKVFFQQKSKQMKKNKPKQLNTDLCGWTNRSFYPQAKNNLIEGIVLNSK